MTKRYVYEAQKNVEFSESTKNKLNQIKNYVDGWQKTINSFNIFSNNQKLDKKAEESFLLFEKRLRKNNLMHLSLTVDIESILLSILDNSFTELCSISSVYNQ